MSKYKSLKINIQTEVIGNYKRIFDQFDRDLFIALKPPLVSLRLERFDGCKKGDKVELYLGVFGIQQIWKSLIVEDQESPEEIYFVDEGVELPPPLKYWRHRHILQNLDETKTMIIDDIEYSSGYKILDFLLYPIMYLQFWYRKPIYKRYFSKK